MNKSTKDMQRVRELVADYVEENGVTNTRQIADYISDSGLESPSTATIATILRELGYTAKRQPSFVWKHNKAHE